MHHYFEALTNTAGQSLIGYFARVINPTTQMQVTLASDDAGTPIQVVSGVANMAKTNEFGNLSLYVTPGTYNLDIYGPDATSFLYRVPNVAMNSSKGDPGNPGPAGPQGEGLDDVMQPTGSALVGFTQSGAGAVARTTLDKSREAVSVLDYGADPTGVIDSTAAFNLATGAAQAHIGNDTPLKRLIRVPAGKYKITGQVFVRKGQTLRGDGRGASMIDATSTGGLGKHLFVMGQSSGGTVDPGGLFCEISGVLMEGGPIGFALIDTSNCAGWAISFCTFLNCSRGINAGGTEGVIENCYGDVNTGQDFMRISGQNIQVSNCQGYIGNRHFVLANGAHNVTIVGCQSVYSKVCGVYFEIGATVKGVTISGCNFDSNVPYDTHIGFVHFAGNNCDLTAVGCTFRNGFAAAFQYSGGVGNSLVASGCVIDGQPTSSNYDISSTFRGWNGGNMDVTFVGCTFRNLPGMPLTLGGGSVTSRTRIISCTFSNNTGGIYEISVNDTNGLSSIYLNGNTVTPPASQLSRTLLQPQGTVPVFARAIASGQATLGGGVATVSNPLVRDSSRISVDRHVDGGTVGASYSVGRTSGTSFTVFAKDGAGGAQAGDSSTLNWTLDLAGV